MLSYLLLSDYISDAACEHIIKHIKLTKTTNDSQYIDKLLFDQTNVLINHIRNVLPNNKSGFYMPFYEYTLLAMTEQTKYSIGKNITQVYSIEVLNPTISVNNSNNKFYLLAANKFQNANEHICIPIINVIWFLSGNGNLDESGGLKMHDEIIISAKASSVVCCIRGWCFPLSTISPTKANSPPLLFVVIPLYYKTEATH